MGWPDDLRVALVHDWLIAMRGGERVLEVLCGLFPHADLYTLVHRAGAVSSTIEGRRIVPSPLQRLPGAMTHHRYYLPLFTWAIGRFDLSGYDLIVSVSHAVAKGVRRGARPFHLCYLLTPMRYAWEGYDDYFGPGRASLPVRMAGRLLGPGLRRWDLRATRGVDRLVAVSRYVADQAQQIYGREAPVVYPPVELARFAPADRREDYFLLAGALTPNKRPDLAVSAFTRLGLPLRVAGTGPEGRRCRRLAGANVTFLGAVSDGEMAKLYARARALVFPGRDDFGLVPLEAQASGTPVIALAAGGALETVTPATGVLYPEPTEAGLIAAVRRFLAEERRFDPRACVANASRFGTERFRREFLEQLRRGWVESERSLPP